MSSKSLIKEIYAIYTNIKPQIITRLKEFKEIWQQDDEKAIFKELIFCLLTPQSKAEVCWRAVESLDNKGLLLDGSIYKIKNELKGVRFNNNKARYIRRAQEMFVIDSEVRIKEFLEGQEDAKKLREWLVKNIKGMGYKEASHFLRNIGLGDNLAILDRHILKNLKLLELIDEIPKALSRRNYLEIEKKMQEFSKRISIPLSHLDFILWYKQTGKVFK